MIQWLKRTFKQEDTSIAKYRLVKLGTSANEVVANAGATDVSVWISDESANSTAGSEVWINIHGTAKLVIASATTKGAFITWTTWWKGLATTTDKNKYIWILLETTTTSDQVAEVLICPGTLSI